MKQRYGLFSLLLLIFLDSLGYFLVIPVLLRLIFDSHGLMSTASLADKNIMLGITIALGFLAMIIAAPYVGRCSDIYGRKKTFLVCLGLSFLGFILPIIGILKSSLSLVIIGRLMAGVGSASQPVAQAAVADVAEGKSKALFLSFIAFAMTLALLLGPLLGGYLSDPNLGFNTETPYLLGALLVILNIVLLQLGFQETLVNPANKQELRFSALLFGIVPAIKQYKIGILLTAVFLLELGWSQYYNAAMLFLGQQYHYSTEQVSNFGSYLGFLMCLGLLFLYPFLIKCFDLKKILQWGMVAVTLGMLGCTFISGVWAQWICVIPVTIFTGISYVGLLALLSNKVPAEKQGWVMGYAMTALALAWFITSFISGYLLNADNLLPFIVSSAVLILNTVLIFLA